MASIRIILDRQQPIYKCGEMISGKIRLCLNEPLPVSEVKISFVGKADVHWTETRTETTSTTDADGNTQTHHHSYTVPYNGSENMAFPTITIWPVGGQLPNSTLSLLGGQHDFGFSFLVPTKLQDRPLLGSLATPLPDGHASITYWLEARVVRQTIRSTVGPIVRSKKRKSDPPSDLFADEKLVIYEYYDLNTEPLAYVPVAISDDEPVECCCVCCCCFSGGQIEVKVSLPKTGYAIGEFLGVTAEIISRTHRKIEKVQIQLVQSGKYDAGGSSKWDSSVLAQIDKIQPLHSGQTQHWTNEGFVIPAEKTRPSLGCGIIKITHHLAIDVVPDGCFSTVRVTVPVIIGTEPLIPSPDPGLPPPYLRVSGLIL